LREPFAEKTKVDGSCNTLEAGNTAYFGVTPLCHSAYQEVANYDYEYRESKDDAPQNIKRVPEILKASIFDGVAPEYVRAARGRCV
jgi:hypothetical protein